MSDSYIALIDPVADATNAFERANKLRDTLISNGIILAETSDDCVFGGCGHLPGPRLNELYDFADEEPDRPAELRYWEMLGICGVEIHTAKWVNMFGFTIFEYAKCPTCSRTFDDSSEIMTPLGDAVGNFLNRDDQTMLECPACHGVQTVQSWTTIPHLGLCHVAAQFWNWPDFNAKGWRLSIPELAGRVLGCELVTTYGRM